MITLLSILQRLSVLNRDDGRRFTNTERLDAIASLLSDSDYVKLDVDGLVHIYRKRALSDWSDPVLIVSAHVDCEYHITKCFASELSDGMLLGTFDNAITNASIVSLMLSGNLPDNVLVAFTGDEEETGRGCKDVIRFIHANRIDVRNIFVLDVTEEGWDQGADFTIENDFWDEAPGNAIIETAKSSGYLWLFVPGDLYDIPTAVPKDRILYQEAAEDESWEYDEADLSCFSFCLPIKGEMHSNSGVYARALSFQRYTEVLERMLISLSKKVGS